MKKQQKTRHNASIQEDEGTDLNAWPPPDIDPDDTKALTAALPWNQPSGMTSEPLQLLEDDEEDDGLTDEQRREEWLRTAPPETLDWVARHDIQSKCIDYMRDNYIINGYAHTISRTHPRDTTAAPGPAPASGPTKITSFSSTSTPRAGSRKSKWIPLPGTTTSSPSMMHITATAPPLYPAPTSAPICPPAISLARGYSS